MGALEAFHWWELGMVRGGGRVGTLCERWKVKGAGKVDGVVSDNGGRWDGWDV